MQLSLERAVQLGMAFKPMMQSEATQDAIKVMKEGYQQTLFASEPSNAKAREQLYLEYRALEDLIATINSFIYIADSEQEPEDEELI